jgi:adenosylmethionine-8-amino-7-oxononanoate aminotransferase
MTQADPNADLLARSRAAVWHPCTQMKVHETLPLVPIVRGEGAWLYDAAGKPYLDAVSSWWVNLFGHGNPRIAAAITAQMATLEHVILAGFTHPAVVELSERLAQVAPPGLGHCFYGSDGASATEIALKMAFHFWRNSGKEKKTAFLSLANSYHGETLGALAVTDVPLFRDVYAPLLRHQARLPSPDPRHLSPRTSPEEAAARAATALEARLARGHESIAALILEPLVQGAAGMVMYHADYLKAARQLCDRYQVLLIADEILTGFGRTGTLFACEQAGITPDLLCLSKGITGGFLPLSCVMSTDRVYAAFYDDQFSRGFLHSHSYTGNALACRAALTVLDIFRDDDVLARNRQRAAQLSAKLAALVGHPKVKDFRRLGMIWAFELNSERPALARWCFSEGLAEGVILRPIGNTLYLMPPYVLGEAEMDHLAQAVIAIVGRA